MAARLEGGRTKANSLREMEAGGLQSRSLLPTGATAQGSGRNNAMRKRWNIHVRSCSCCCTTTYSLPDFHRLSSSTSLVSISEARSHPFESMLGFVSGGVAVHWRDPHAGDG